MKRMRWWAAALALFLAGAASTVGSGKPFALSVLDGLVLVAFAVLVGTYAILARADRERRARKEEPGVERAPPEAP